MTAAQAAQLRAPFKPEQIGKLPKLSCKRCSESPTKVCGEHKKTRCATCGSYISTAHIDLDYVGHAATTDRLLTVDPEWTWRPMAVGANGEPLITKDGLWIELTLCGVTRPGFGDGKTPKEIIGDAIRNAAMRFGVALDLWAKEDLSTAHEEAPTSSNGAAPAVDMSDPDIPFGDAPYPEPPVLASDAQKKKLGVLVGRLRDGESLTTEHLYRAVKREPVPGDDGVLHFGPLLQSLTKAEAHSLIDRLENYERHREAAEASV